MKLPFLWKNSSSSWAWPSCQQTRTLSFRTNVDKINMFKTINSAYSDVVETSTTTRDSSLFTNTNSQSASATSFSTTEISDESTRGEDEEELSKSVEAVIKGLKSADRLFFEPGETSSSIVEDLNMIKESTLVVSMESEDPYVDFRKSMEEMVEAHSLKGWEDLEELLCWYFSVNDKTNHDYILAAFLDLLVALACCISHDSPSSPLSFYTSSSSSCCCSSSSSSGTPTVSALLEITSTSLLPCLSSLFEAEDDEISKEIINVDDEASSSSS